MADHLWHEELASLPELKLSPADKLLEQCELPKIILKKDEFTCETAKLHHEGNNWQVNEFLRYSGGFGKEIT